MEAQRRGRRENWGESRTERWFGEKRGKGWRKGVSIGAKSGVLEKYWGALDSLGEKTGGAWRKVGGETGAWRKFVRPRSEGMDKKRWRLEILCTHTDTHPQAAKPKPLCCLASQEPALSSTLGDRGWGAACSRRLGVGLVMGGWGYWPVVGVGWLARSRGLTGMVAVEWLVGCVGGLVTVLASWYKRSNSAKGCLYCRVKSMHQKQVGYES